MTGQIVMMVGLGLLLLVVPVGMACWLDAKLANMLWRALWKFLVGMAVVALCLWGLWLVGSWWLCGLWLLLASGLSAAVGLSKNRLPVRRWWLSLTLVQTLVVAVVSALVASVQPWAFSLPVFVGVTAVLLTHSAMAATSGLRAFTACKRATQPHQDYLLGNGATRLEALLPSVRYGFRAMLLPSLHAMSLTALCTLPLLLSGLLIGMVAPLAAVGATILLTLASLAASTFVLLLMLCWTERQG